MRNLGVLSCVWGVVAVGSAIASGEPAALTDTQKVVHVLNRLGFGARPGDVERVRSMGIDAYVAQQLRPESIDDSACDTALVRFDTLQMDSGHLSDAFLEEVRSFLQMQMAAGNADEMKLRYGVDMTKVKADPQTKPAAAPGLKDLAGRDALRCVSELQQAKLVRAVLSERQLNEVMVDFWTNHFNIDIRKNQIRALKVADDRFVVRRFALGKFRDLLGASAHSPAMLAYLDNSDNSVTRERSRVEQYIIESYVKNKLGVEAKGLIPEKEGPNENYGREILELHTLGVDGGYTQKDVQEVARCFSGWGIGLGGRFEFNKDRHDRGEKTVLGHTIPAGRGVEDGEQVLDILAVHPSTAHFVSRKLCQRFVSDDPPAELVDRTAKVFLDSGGDIRQVLASIFASPEFSAPSAYHAKVKSPFEFAVSAIRATRGRFVEPAPLAGKLQAVMEGAATLGYGADKLTNAKRKSLNWNVWTMGEPLFAFTAPTGYPENSAKWVSPGALIDRLNFALALTQQQVTDVRIDTDSLLKGVDADQPEKVLDRLSASLLYGDMTPKTLSTLREKALPHGPGETVDVQRLTALILGSPEFQRR